MSDTQFPLATSKLPRLRVDAQTLAAWTQTARDAIHNVLADRTSWYYTPPPTAHPSTAAKKQCVFDKKGVHGFALSPDSSRTKAFYGEGSLHLSLEDIAYGLYCDDTLQQRVVSAYVHDKAFLDAAVLHVAERRTVADPFRFAGVKWAAFKSPPGAVTQYTAHDATTDSDFVYFEYSCKTVDANRNVVLVQYVASLALSSLRAGAWRDHRAGLARGTHTQVSTFELRDDRVAYKTMGSFDVGKALPSWVAMKAVLQALSSVTHLEGLADVRAVSSLLGVSTAGATARAATTKTCQSCKKKFGLTRKRLNCHACGQCVCKQCALSLRFISPHALRPSSSTTSTSASLLRESKFCLQCVRVSRAKRPARGSFCRISSSNSDRSRSDSSSSGGAVHSILSQESTSTLSTSIDEHSNDSNAVDHVALDDRYDSDSDDSDYWDLHDDDGNDDDDSTVEYETEQQAPLPLRLFDSHGAHITASSPPPVLSYKATHANAKSVVVHEPRYTDNVVTIQGVSRSLVPTPERQQRRRRRQQQQMSPVEAFVARSRAVAVANAATADGADAIPSDANRRKNAPSTAVRASPRSPRSPAAATPATTPPPARAATSTYSSGSADVFSKLTQSLAAQEQLLQSIQHEANKLRARTTSGEEATRNRHRTASLPIPENDRFEVVVDL